jgi:hypothetical protein
LKIVKKEKVYQKQFPDVSFKKMLRHSSSNLQKLAEEYASYLEFLKSSDSKEEMDFVVIMNERARTEKNISKISECECLVRKKEEKVKNTIIF